MSAPPRRARDQAFPGANREALSIPMAEAEARQITTRIKLLFSSTTETVEKIKNLIDQAEAGQAWQALGYPSWTAYFTAEFSGSAAGLERAMRGRVVAALAEAGMSVRGIAAVTGTSIGTAHGDLVTSGVQQLNTSTSTTGNDGKQYVRNGRPTSTGVIAISDAAPGPTPKPRRPPLPDQYTGALSQVEKLLRKMQGHQADDRFARIARDPAYLGRVTLLHELMIELHETHIVAVEKAAVSADD